MITKEIRIVGGFGSLYTAGTETGLKHFMIEAREDTTLTSVTGVDDTGAVVDVLALWGLSSGVTLNQFEQYYTPMNVVITGIVVLTGSVKLN